MDYIVYKRFKDKAICGNINLPVNTICQLRDNMLFYNDKPLCLVTSYSSEQHFARNDDGQGLLRGKMTQAIIKKLSKRDNDYQTRWNKVWSDFCCNKYKRVEHTDYWLWNNQFYSAPIEDLKYIMKLIGLKEI